MIEDRDLAEVRQKYYGLLVRLLGKEPEPDFLLSLSEGIVERIEFASQSNPTIAEGWRYIDQFLQEKDPHSVPDEFTMLFLGPHKPVITPFESFYFTGNLYQTPLIEVREFMNLVGPIKRKDDLPETEDFLAFELEILNYLVSKQLEGFQLETVDNWLELQANFLKKHVLVWAPTCARDIEMAEHADFYVGVGKILRGFLELERLLFQYHGPETIMTLEEGRLHYGGERSFKGPIFEPELLKENLDPTDN